MWEMAKNSMTLFFQGKLFKNPSEVYRQLAIGIILTVAILLGLAFAGLPLWLCASVAGLIGGAVQPYLFKDLKYR